MNFLIAAVVVVLGVILLLLLLQFLAAMQQLGFGRFERLQIRSGELVFNPEPVTVRDVKFGSPVTIGQQSSAGCELRPQIAEWRKQLTSILIEAPPLVIIDNVATVADWPGFCKVITGEMHRDRLLGKSQTVSVAVRCSWIITGNNLQLAGDMARRCYWIRMDAGCSDPFRRTGFKHERLKEYVLEHRRELLIALLTIARAWFAAGQPKASTPLVGSFERWTEVIAGILQHAQVDGFLANSERLFEQSDVERSDWETFIEATEDAFPGVPFSIAEFWERLNEKSYEELIRQSVLTDRAEQLRNALPADLTRWMDREGPFKQRLGVAFNQRRGRRFGKRQLRIERAAGDTHGKVARWKVEADA